MAQVRVNALAFALMVKAVYEKPRTLHEIADLTGLHLWTVRHYIKALHKQELVHITKWDPDTMGRDTTPYWTFGMGVDVPRRRKTGSQKMRELRARQREAIMELNAA